MEDKLIELLESLGYPVMRQGSLSNDDPYPSTFFTFWNNDDYEHSAYDNRTVSAESNFDVNVYSDNPQTTYDLLDKARKLLKQNGFSALSRGYDVESDENTHTGRGMNVTILYHEKLKED